MIDQTHLPSLLSSLTPSLRAGEYVYALWPEDRPLEDSVAAVIREAEGTTAVLSRERADELGLDYSFIAAWITLDVRSALEAVGLTAAVSTALTAAHISCNVLAGFHHDHLLVPAADAERAMETLRELSAAHSGQEPAAVADTLVLRSETPADRPAILGLIGEAFAVSPVTGRPVEEPIVEVGLLEELFDCAEYLPELSVVAEYDGRIVGYAISTRGWVDDFPLLGLGPIGVVPRLQQHGIGSALMAETIKRANAAGERGIALLGSPGYYERFGFVAADSFGILAPEASWGHYFQFLPLALWPGGVHGTFRYAGPFARL
ncbi:ACT domain-containing protein [Pseudarthrobacter sp. J64]|uniref:N-acetyltransferase n=1 Tax=Pseudarthrobacter sp. J64 TaxID=3116485 RepID=UPI002E821715|nr:ACT domain-containing protein [Pseudarthrobacter sp. J64]MEE2570851.1 ACT domain-containing protein [Pseudarthrobacter sp. J64]